MKWSRSYIYRGTFIEETYQIAPMAAKSLIDAIKNNNVENDLLQLTGILHGRGLKAEDLILAIQSE